MKKQREYQKFSPIRSGLSKKTSYKDREEYKYTITYFDGCLHDLRYVRFRAPSKPNDTSTNAYKLLKPYQESAEQTIVILEKMLKEYRQSFGVGNYISNEADVLPLLPEHRVTAGPLETVYHVAWKLSFPASIFPCLVEASQRLDFNQHRDTCIYSDEPITPARQEIKAFHEKLLPLTDAGFNWRIEFRRISKANILAELFLCHGYD